MIVTRGLGQDSGQPTSLVMWGCGTYVLQPIVYPTEEEGSTPGSRRRRKDRVKIPPVQLPQFEDNFPVVVEGVGTVVQLVIVQGYSTPLSILSTPYFTYTPPQTEEVPVLVRSAQVERRPSSPIDRIGQIAAYLLRHPQKGELAEAIEEVISIREARGFAVSTVQHQYMRGDSVNIAASRMQFGLEVQAKGRGEYIHLPEDMGALEINEQELVLILDLLTRE